MYLRGQWDDGCCRLILSGEDTAAASRWLRSFTSHLHAQQGTHSNPFSMMLAFLASLWNIRQSEESIRSKGYSVRRTFLTSYRILEKYFVWYSEGDIPGQNLYSPFTLAIFSHKLRN